MRDADKIIGELGRAEKDNISLIVNRIRPQMVESGDMMDMSDIDDILAVKCIGQGPDDEMVVRAWSACQSSISRTNSARYYSPWYGENCEDRQRERTDGSPTTEVH